MWVLARRCRLTMAMGRRDASEPVSNARWPQLGYATRSRSSARRSTGRDLPHLLSLASPHTDFAFELKTRIKIFLELKHASIIQHSRLIYTLLNSC